MFPTYGVNAGLVLEVPEAYARVAADVQSFGKRGASPANVFDNNAERYSLEGYTLLNLTVTSRDWQLMPDRETRLSARVWNLLGESFADPGFGGIDVPSLGRTFMVELRQEL